MAIWVHKGLVLCTVGLFEINPTCNAIFKYYMSILGRWGVQNLGKHIYIILEYSPKNLSLKLSLEHFKKFFSPPYFMFYVCFFIFNYYRSLSIGIVLKYHFHYHYHYRSKSHYRTSLVSVPNFSFLACL